MTKQVTDESRSNRRKLILVFTLLIGTLGLTAGLMTAFFSDWIAGTGSATAGTLDISGTFSTYYDADQDNTPELVTSVNNFNPGDMMIVKGTVTNSGNKSAWLRSKIDLSGLDTDIAPFIKICAGELTKADETTCTALTDGATTTPVILNGTGADAETETASGAVGSNATAMAYTIYFLSTATNDAQGKTVTAPFVVEAMQYRNNPTPTWTSLEQIP